MMHISTGFAPDGEGWYSIGCGCGQHLGEFPDAETAADALAAHAYDAGYADGSKEKS